IPDLAAAIARHAEYLRTSGDWSVRERVRLEAELDHLILARLEADFHNSLGEQAFEQALDQMVDRRLSPAQAADLLLKGGMA
ncbi:MAG TPA: hypothetical protein VIV15_05710, partial [Anaerolineales bacterium]